MNSQLSCHTSSTGVCETRASTAREHVPYSSATLSPISISQSIARDLHDSFPQEFQAVIMHLRVALEATTCADSKHHVEQAMSAAQTGLNCVRTLVRALRSGRQAVQTVEPQCLMEVVADAARCALKTHHVRFHLINRSSELSIDPASAVQIAMVVREATHNAVKHGSPTLVTCQVIEMGPAIAIEIRDDGHGFDLDRMPSGFGLVGMKERAASIGATLTVVSQSGEGCAIRLTLAKQSVAWPVSGPTLSPPGPGSLESYVPVSSLADDLLDPISWSNHRLATYACGALGPRM